MRTATASARNRAPRRQNGKCWDRTSPRRRRAGGAWDQRGSSAIEFALLAPVLVILLMGILAYGGYFLMAHALQQLANDAARASVAGLSDSERSSLASGSVAAELPNYSFLNPSLAQVNVTDQAEVTTVQLSYDASQTPIFSLRGLVPMPSSTITRTAAIQLGGY